MAKNMATDYARGSLVICTREIIKMANGMARAYTRGLTEKRKRDGSRMTSIMAVAIMTGRRRLANAAVRV